MALAIYRFQVDALIAIATAAAPTGVAPECRDEDDRKYLHCAQFADADYLVTYDRDLLDAQALIETRILTPAEFLGALRGRGVNLAL